MAKPPAFQFYYKDWQSSRRVRLMGLAARGLYVEMLGRQWEDGSVPDDPEVVAQLIGVPLAEVVAVWSQVRSCFDSDDQGELQNQALEERRTEYAELVQKMTKLSAKGHAKRYGKRSAKRASNNNIVGMPVEACPASASASAPASALEEQVKSEDHASH